MQHVTNSLLSASGKISLFISHCGSFGSQEAIYNGVPIAALPLFEDQFYNAQRIVDKQLGLMLPSYKVASVEEVSKMLMNLLSSKGSVKKKYYDTLHTFIPMYFFQDSSRGQASV